MFVIRRAVIKKRQRVLYGWLTFVVLGFMVYEPIERANHLEK